MRHDRLAIISGANPIPAGAIRLADRCKGAAADVEDHAARRHVRACRLEYDSFELKDIWFTSSRLRGEGEVAASIVKVSDDDPGTRLAAMR